MVRVGAQVTIRSATLDDMALLFPLVESFMAMVPLALEVDAALVYETLVALCESPQACVFVAETEAGLVGFVVGCQSPYLLNPRVTVMQEQAFFVAPQAQGRGVGSALLTALETWGQSVEARVVILSCFEGMPAIAQMYHRRGYVAFEQHYVKEV